MIPFYQDKAILEKYNIYQNLKINSKLISEKLSIAYLKGKIKSPYILN